MTEYNVPHGKLNRGMAVLDGVFPGAALGPCGARLHKRLASQASC